MPWSSITWVFITEIPSTTKVTFNSPRVTSSFTVGCLLAYFGDLGFVSMYLCFARLTKTKTLMHANLFKVKKYIDIESYFTVLQQLPQTKDNFVSWSKHGAHTKFNISLILVPCIPIRHLKDVTDSNKSW